MVMLMIPASALTYTSSVYFSTIVPTTQGYNGTDSVQISCASTYGSVVVDSMTNEAVTFHMRSANVGVVSDYVTVYNYATGQEKYINYNTTQEAGTVMQAGFRNHNWTLNGGFISGRAYFD